MICLAVIISTVGTLGLIFAMGFAAKIASRRYQRHSTGIVDEEVAMTWQNRVVLLGIILALINFASHLHWVVNN